MEITIKGESKEIAALVLAVQERRNSASDIIRSLNDSIAKSSSHCLLI